MKPPDEIIPELDKLIAQWKEEISTIRHLPHLAHKDTYQMARIVCQLELLKEWIDDEPKNVVALFGKEGEDHASPHRRLDQPRKPDGK